MKWTWWAAVWMAASAMSQAQNGGGEARELLGAHNAVRAKVGVSPLTWSTELEKTAREWAEGLLASGKFGHRPQNAYGENLFEIRGGKGSAAQVMTSWAQEAKDYDLDTNTCRSGATCGHYTQIVWRNTKQVGCAVVRGKGREIWVCDYDPAGNWEGQRPY